MKNKILKPIFWDVDVEKIDLKKHSYQIIDRILEYGDSPQVHWMFVSFPKKEIIKVVKKSRQLTSKSANFWAWFYHISKNEVRCLNKRFLATRRSTWPY